MKKSTPLLFLMLMVSLMISCNQESQTPFDQYFTPATLRIDYWHSGDAENEEVILDKSQKYETWAGSRVNLIDSMDYGAYYHKAYDAISGKLIYSKGFDSYFKEYQVSTPALEGEVKKFHETAMLPYPNEKIYFVLEKRMNSGDMKEVFRIEIDPSEASVEKTDPEVKVFTSLDNGSPSITADIAIIGEGYTSAEETKFKEDLERFTEIFFKAEPCRSHKDRFNIRGVFKPSEDSGIDEPRAGIDKNTAVNASFNTMGSGRYILTEDNKSLRDIAGHAPYDALYIMINHSRYGGGGIYNFYCTFTSDNIHSEYLMVHEFGHSFFGLADEYYTSSTAYNDFYSPEHEPSEPNITALLDPENIKWKSLLSADLEIPTPWKKTSFDSTDLIWQQKRAELNDEIAKMQKNNADTSLIKAAKNNYDLMSKKRDSLVQAYLENSIYAGKVGAFEGAGYKANGLYRPSINCIMFTRTDYFCPVCQQAMVGIINNYSR